MKHLVFAFGIFCFQFIQAQTVQNAIPLSGLIAYYPFNGNANDESGNGNHGKVFGATLTADRYGKTNSAYSFNGRDNNIITAPLTNGLKAFTISMWFKPNDWEGYSYYGKYVWSANKSQGDVIDFGKHPDFGNSLIFGLYDAGWNWANSKQALVNNQYYHVVASWGNEGIILFINGNMVAFNSYKSLPKDLPTRCTIGSSSYSSSYFSGVIDDVALWSRQLTKDEVLSIYEGNTKRIEKPSGEIISSNPISKNENSQNHVGQSNGLVKETKNASTELSVYIRTFDQSTNNDTVPIAKIQIGKKNCYYLSRFQSVTRVEWTEGCRKHLIDGDGTLTAYDEDEVLFNYQGNIDEGQPNGRGTLSFKDGIMYTGNFINGLREGEGTVVFQDGSELKGNFSSNTLEGIASHTSKDGYSFKGIYKNGRRNGEGVLTTPDSDIFKGSWVNGRLNGKTEVLFANGDRLSGNFVNDVLKGESKYIWKDGREYFGEYTKGGLNGKGTLKYIDGSKYSGEFKNDKRHGEGSMSYPDGTEYTGSWTNGFRNGFGRITFTDGLKFIGYFIDDKPQDGIGTLVQKSGITYEGEIKNMKMNGKGTLTLSNGDKLFGDFKENAFVEGIGTLIQKSGNIYEGEIKDSKMNGKGTINFPNGDRLIGTFMDNGLVDGIWTYIWKNRDYYEGEFKQGRIYGNGIKTLVNGDKYSGIWLDGKLQDGLVKIETSENVYEGEWKNGMKNGQGILIKPKKDSEVESFEGNFVNGNPERGRIIIKDDKGSKDVYDVTNGDIASATKRTYYTTKAGYWEYDMRDGEGYGNVRVYDVNGKKTHDMPYSYENQSSSNSAASKSNEISDEEAKLALYLLLLGALSSDNDNTSRPNTNSTITRGNNVNKCYTCSGTGNCSKCTKPQRVRYKDGEFPRDRTEIRHGRIVCTQCGGNLMNWGTDRNKSCYLCKATGWLNCPDCNVYGEGKNIGKCSRCRGTGVNR